MTTKPTTDPRRVAGGDAAATPEFPDSADRLLKEDRLADRWDCSTKKLQADRLKGTGCPFVKIGRAVRYRLSDVLQYERDHRASSTSEVR